MNKIICVQNNVNYEARYSEVFGSNEMRQGEEKCTFFSDCVVYLIKMKVIREIVNWLLNFRINFIFYVSIKTLTKLHFKYNVYRGNEHILNAL